MWRIKSGRFPNEIKNKIRCLIICCYHNLTSENMITTNNKLAYFSFNINRKSTYLYCAYVLRYLDME